MRKPFGREQVPGSSAARRGWRQTSPSTRCFRIRRPDPSSQKACGRIRPPCLPFPHQAAVEQDPSADSFRHRHGQHICCVAQFSKPTLRKQAGIGGILHHDRSLERLLQLTLQVDAGPGRIGRKHQPMRLLVDAPGNTHAHPVDDASAKCRPQRSGGSRNGVERGPEIALGTTLPQRSASDSKTRSSRASESCREYRLPPGWPFPGAGRRPA